MSTIFTFLLRWLIFSLGVILACHVMKLDVTRDVMQWAIFLVVTAMITISGWLNVTYK